MPFYFGDLSEDTVREITGDSFDKAFRLAIEPFVGNENEVQHTFFSLSCDDLNELRNIVCNAGMTFLAQWETKQKDQSGSFVTTYYLACSERMRVTFDDTVASVLRIAKLIENKPVQYEGWSLHYKVRGGPTFRSYYATDGPEEYFMRSSGGLFGVLIDILLGKYSDKRWRIF
ncbi:MAG: hypothetical protein ACRCWJ_13600 [Casimicrobium sp.]